MQTNPASRLRVRRTGRIDTSRRLVQVARRHAGVVHVLQGVGASLTDVISGQCR